MSQRLVIYHGNCYDGVTAAWICWLRFGKGVTEFLPLNYSDPPPNVKDKDVVIVDFSFKRLVMDEISANARSLIVLDHHKTAEEELKGKPYAIFDMNRSGAGIAWDYFYPNTPRPDLVNYIEDRDLWRFQLPDSKVYNAWIQSFDINLETWISTVGLEFLVGKDIFESGRSILRVQDKYVKQICHNARLRRLGTYLVPSVYTSILMSECCDYMLKNGSYEPLFVFYWFQRLDGKFQYGLRSRNDFDVSVIAKSFGGGGHKNAAGFELDKELNSLIPMVEV